MPCRWTEEQLYQEVIATPRDAFVALPDMQIIRRPDWQQLVTPWMRTGGLNEVSFAALDEAAAGAAIAATIAQYRDLGLRFRWLVVPGSRPPDLAERLARHGLQRSTVRAMYRGTGAPVASHHPLIQVQRVEDPAALGVFTTLMASGWGVDPAPLHDYHRALWHQAERRHRLFIAHRGDTPAGAAAYVAFERSAYLLGAVILPAFRGQGLYRALVAERLRDAARRGLALATVQAREETAAPILQHLGFTFFCSFPVFSGPPPEDLADRAPDPGA
jgi:GNAT superfamily N-acetyltransferase